MPSEDDDEDVFGEMTVSGTMSENDPATEPDPGSSQQNEHTQGEVTLRSSLRT